jgi:hypothetical protein
MGRTRELNVMEVKVKSRRERKGNCLNNELKLFFGGRIGGFWFTWMDVSVSQTRKERGFWFTWMDVSVSQTRKELKQLRRYGD